MISRMVIFGATGDLTARLLLPAVAQLVESNALPSDIRILGSAVESVVRREISHAYRPGAGCACRPGVAGNAAEGGRHARLSSVGRDRSNRRCSRHRHGPWCQRSSTWPCLPVCWRRRWRRWPLADLGSEDAVAIEKPFGTDLASAQRLNALLASGLSAPTIFRIDHFLSNELVRRIVALRFANQVFEPILNANHVERVDISWLESLTLEGRAAYYDRAGALKDMLQNHLMEALSLVVMEEPARLDAISFRNSRVEALRNIATPTLADIQAGTIRARYTAGVIGDRQVPAYVDEPGVDPTRGTESYAAITLSLQNRRWAGVPFTLRSGKSMPADTAEIAIHFRPLPPHLFDLDVDVPANVLRIGLMESYVRLDTTINGSDAAPGRAGVGDVGPAARAQCLRQSDPRDVSQQSHALHPRR